MSNITLAINFTKNTSLQKGDQIYYLDNNGGIKRIGPAIIISDKYITCTAEGN